MLPVQVQLLHLLVAVADADEGTELSALLRLALPLHLLPLLPPAVTVEVDARRGTEESLLVAVGLLGHLGVEHHNDHVSPLIQVSSHCFPCQLPLISV